MKKILYSVKEVSEILDLHPKTVQRFIREGKLKARKIGRAWKINIEDFKDYAHAELSGAQSQIANEKPVSAISDRLTVSAVIELREAGNAESDRISNTLIAVLNGKDPSWGEARYNYIYQPETGTARFILYGTPLFISSMMKMLEPLLVEQE